MIECARERRQRLAVLVAHRKPRVDGDRADRRERKPQRERDRVDALAQRRRCGEA